MIATSRWKGESTRPRLGLVLGAGAARGWAHIGALRALERLGVRPDVVVGCSSGALVAASYANGRLDSLEHFARALTWRGVLSYFDLTWKGGGLIEGRWLVDFFREHVGDIAIEDSPMSFAAVATELKTGRETWLTRGSMVDAVRASISLPGLVTPVRLGEHWLVDGALVNPIPVSLCRALGADVIIAVSMQGDLVTSSRGLQANRIAPMLETPHGPVEPEPQSSWLAWLGAPFSGWGGAGASAAIRDDSGAQQMAGGTAPTTPPILSAGSLPAGAQARPGYFDVIGDSFFTVQNFVSRVRLAADPVDVLIAPQLERFGVLDFHRGAEAIEAGEAAVEAQADRLRHLLVAIDRAPRGGGDPQAAERETEDADAGVGTEAEMEAEGASEAASGGSSGAPSGA